MRLIVFAVSLLINFMAAGQTKNPFTGLQFDKVVMYDYEASGEKARDIVNREGRLDNLIKKSVLLRKNTIHLLNTKLGDKRSYGGGTAACFDPHLGFVYYRKEKIMAYLSVCLGCNRLSSSLDIPAQHQGKVGKGKDAYYLSDGLSKLFRKFLNRLMVQNSFSHLNEKSSVFD